MDYGRGLVHRFVAPENISRFGVYVAPRYPIVSNHEVRIGVWGKDDLCSIRATDAIHDLLAIETAMLPVIGGDGNDEENSDVPSEDYRAVLAYPFQHDRRQKLPVAGGSRRRRLGHPLAEAGGGGGLKAFSLD